MNSNFIFGGDITDFGGDITDLWGGHHGPLGDVNNFCMKLIWGGQHGPLGGTSRTFGGDITDLWGGHHGPKHPWRPQKHRWF